MLLNYSQVRRKAGQKDRTYGRQDRRRQVRSETGQEGDKTGGRQEENEGGRTGQAEDRTGGRQAVLWSRSRFILAQLRLQLVKMAAPALAPAPAPTPALAL